MKHSGECEKCASTNIIIFYGYERWPHIQNRQAISWLTVDKSVYINRYVCEDCGYVEFWLDDVEKLDVIKRHLKRNDLDLQIRRYGRKKKVISKVVPIIYRERKVNLIDEDESANDAESNGSPIVGGDGGPAFVRGNHQEQESEMIQEMMVVVTRGDEKILLTRTLDLEELQERNILKGAVREFYETTGASASIPETTYLGAKEFEALNEYWHFVLCCFGEDVPDEWEHHPDGEEGWMYKFQWQPITQPVSDEPSSKYEQARTFFMFLLDEYLGDG